MAAPGLFVTATDTGVGKTIVAAALAARLRADGLRVAAVKPLLTGVDEPEPGIPSDDVLLAQAAGLDPKAVTFRRFGPAVSPHLAAELAGETLDVETLIAATRAACEGADRAIVEGVGGLLVPLAPDWDVRRYAAALGLPVVIAARTGLGTINHTLLSVEAACAAGLRVCAVVLTPWPATPSVIEASNRATLERLAGVSVDVLPHVASLAAADLADAAASLPYEDWLAGQ